MALSSYLRDALLNHVLHGAPYPQPTNIFCSLQTGDPGLNGANEVSGGSYSRQSVTNSFAPVVAGSGAKISNADVTFVGLPAATITFIGIWDASSSGNFLWGLQLTSPKPVSDGGTLELASGNITATMA